MQTMDEEPLETIHLYVVREETARPPLLPVFLAVLTLLVLILVCVLPPYPQPEEHKTIHVPAVFLPLIVFTASVHIIPTGIKTYPATASYGVLTVYNGSILSQQIPQGMIVTATNGIEIVTDESVFVPAGNPPYYGIAEVPSHEAVAGQQGNIPAFSINEVYGTSLYIRNLQPFKGGENSYSVKVETAQDRQTAIDAARAILTTQEAKIQAFLVDPCQEVVNNQVSIVKLVVKCQFVTYTVASYMKVTHLRLIGKTLFVDVVFAARPRIIVFK